MKEKMQKAYSDYISALVSGADIDTLDKLHLEYITLKVEVEGRD